MWDEHRQSDAAQHSGARARTEAHLRAFRAHWEACRKGQDVPKRTDIDPRRIEPLLSNAFIAERIAPGVVRLRIAGMHLSDLMGMEVRGMPLCSFIAPAARKSFALHLVDLFDRPATLRLGLHSGAGLGRPALSGTMLLLPLRSDLGDVSRALGCLVTHGHIGRPARRFTIDSAQVQPLTEPTHPAPFSVIAGTGTALRVDPRDRPNLRLVT
ncbi:PAS domain-containing protein [Roseovarius autotrophicus]|uniref:PAS domain-containing protein n=1 Tax=Roseovarius autotrophicus TaxID=2824121 RepID=UPI0019E62FC6|nr:PAS domain-containing protein [Roseovarius autotrophicus]MBE0452153.1 PAS domain-containing protein [Roseovarius sp.]